MLFAQSDLIDRAVLMHPLIPFTPPPQPGLAGTDVLVTAGRRDSHRAGRDDRGAVRLAHRTGRATSRASGTRAGHELRDEEFAAARDFLSR